MVINFNVNWNKKLHARAFTTIRMFKANKYKVGQKYQVNLQGKKHCDVLIVDIKPFLIAQLGQWTSYLDTGYDVKDTIEILKRLYHQHNINNEKFLLILLRRI